MERPCPMPRCPLLPIPFVGGPMLFLLLLFHRHIFIMLNIYAQFKHSLPSLPTRLSFLVESVIFVM